MPPDVTTPVPPTDAGKVIALEYVYTREEAMRGSLAAARAVVPKVRFVPWLGILLLGVAAYVLVRDPAAWLGAAIPGCFGLFFVSIPLLTRALISRAFRRFPAANAPITWEISADRLVTRAPNGDARMSWSGLNKVVPTRHGFLVFTSPRVGHWLPRRAFASAADVAQFEAWVEAKRASFGTGGAAPEATAPTPSASLPPDDHNAAADAITAKYIFTEADALASHRLVTHSVPVAIRYVGLFPVAIVAGIIAIQGNDPLTTVLTLAFVTGVFTFAIRRARRKQRRGAVDAFAQSPNANREIQWTISQQQIAIRSASSNHVHDWKAVVKVRESDDGFLVFAYSYIGSWLPHRAFASPHDAALLRAWINRHGIDFRRV